MRVQIVNGEILAWGVQCNGYDTFDAPIDYSPEKYTYTPNEDGSFNPNGFTLTITNTE
jgi:hypothetical protein